MTTPTNNDIAYLLIEIADKLNHQKANPYRVTAYRNAAKKVKSLKKNLSTISDHDHLDELIAIPTIGQSIANVIIEYVNTGSSQFLNRINGYNYVENTFDEIPGIGPHLSHLISSRLNIKTLIQLQKAYNDGRLVNIPGFGPKRLNLVKMALDNLLIRDDEQDAKIIPINTPQIDDTLAPEASVLLRLDYLYRNKAQLGELHKLKPRKFNPNQQAWLPIYHKEIDGWHFTCLYSNTVTAHKMNMTKDWVVISYEKDGVDGQCTIVSKIQGDLSGQRVIRGREEECLKFYMSKLVKEF